MVPGHNPRGCISTIPDSTMQLRYTASCGGCRIYREELCQVQLTVNGRSAYVIRTQPTRSSLSTLECIAHTLTWLENDNGLAEVWLMNQHFQLTQWDSLIQVLVKPLRALCHHQLQHGAVEHHSKDNPDYISRAEMK